MVIIMGAFGEAAHQGGAMQQRSCSPPGYQEVNGDRGWSPRIPTGAHPRDLSVRPHLRIVPQAGDQACAKWGQPSTRWRIVWAPQPAHTFPWRYLGWFPWSWGRRRRERSGSGLLVTQVLTSPGQHAREETLQGRCEVKALPSSVPEWLCHFLLPKATYWEALLYFVLSSFTCHLVHFSQ